MANKFLELASSPLMNLDHTYRYSGTKLVEAESLSQHIVDTIIMGMKIIDRINSILNCDMLSIERYVMKAVYHDLEEVITGDIPRPLKYYNEQTRDSLKDVADMVAQDLFKREFSDWKAHYSIWDDAKSGDEGIILKVVDTLVVANKVVKEVTLLNNNYMLRVAHEVSKYLIEIYDHINLSPTNNPIFSQPDVKKYLLDVIDGAISAMEHVIEENQECMTSLNIHGQSMI